MQPWPASVAIDQTYIQGAAQLVAMNVKTRSMTRLLAVDRGLERPYLYAALRLRGRPSSRARSASTWLVPGLPAA